MSRFDRPVLRAAAISALMLVVGLTLAACGRRGPPEASPGTFIGPQGAYELDEQGRPIAAPGPKRRLPIDALLD